MTQLMTDAEIAQGLSDSFWERDGDAIVRDLRLANFAEVIALVNRIADLAEERGHHPDMLIHGWNQLRISSSTHSAGGLTAADFALAGAIDSLL